MLAVCIIIYYCVCEILILKLGTLNVTQAPKRDPDNIMVFVCVAYDNHACALTTGTYTLNLTKYSIHVVFASGIPV